VTSPDRTNHPRLRAVVDVNHTARLNRNIAAAGPPPTLAELFRPAQLGAPTALPQRPSSIPSDNEPTQAWSASTLMPGTSSGGWIAEDSGVLQRNLRRGTQPVSLSRMANRTEPTSQSRHILAQFDLPDARYQDRQSGPVDLWRKLHQGQPLSDGEIRQLFHTLTVARHAANTREETIQTASARIHAEQQLAMSLLGVWRSARPMRWMPPMPTSATFW